MKSALQIVAYANVTDTEGTIALLEVAIAGLSRAGFNECADLATLALDQFVEESVLRMKGDPAIQEVTKH